MFNEESEIQSRHKALEALHGEARKILESSNALIQLYDALIRNNHHEVEACLEKIRKAEEDVAQLRRVLIRELAETNGILIDSQEFMRSAYEIEEISGYLTGIAFKLNHLPILHLRKSSTVIDNLRDFLEMSTESVKRLNEVVRVLAINPNHAAELSASVQQLEMLVDDKYRDLTMKILNEIDAEKDILLLKDIAQGIECLADDCLRATNSLTILALDL